MSDSITIGAYLLERLVQLGVTAIFGVPGDFNLAFLDLIEDHPKLEWIGCCNELNASYAADGYARTRRGLGVLLTTFGVGELSAVNGVAGSYSERVPVIHVVGVPSTKLQAHKAMLHHTLGDHRFEAFYGVYSHVTAAQAFLTSVYHNTDGRSAAEEIDRILKIALRRCQPTYLTLPTDLVFAEIPSSPLKTPITMQTIRQDIIDQGESQEKVDFVVHQIVDIYKKSERPMILIDACAIRFGVTDLTKELVESTGLPFFTTPMGKTALDEDHPQFSGCYIGSVSKPEVSKVVEEADFILSIGSLRSDFNTGSFSYKFRPDQQVDLHSDHVMVQYARYDGLGFHVVLPSLIKALENVKPKGRFNVLPGGALSSISSPPEDGPIKQDVFWPLFAHYLKPNDVTLSETGTSSFGILDIKMPPGTTHQSQVLWGSIGWAGGAVVGASYAAKEQGRRTVLFTGEGSYQLTVQDVSQIIRLGLKPILVVLNNKGYTIERFIHGMKRHYNDIPDWQWQETFNYFGAKPGTTKTYSVSTYNELLAVLRDPEFQKADKPQLLEVHMGAEDAPRALLLQAELSAKANAD